MAKIPRSKLPRFSFSEAAPKPKQKKTQSIHVHNTVSEASGSKQTTRRSIVVERQQLQAPAPATRLSDEAEAVDEGTVYHITEDDVRQPRKRRRTRRSTRQKMKRVSNFISIRLSQRHLTRTRSISLRSLSAADRYSSTRCSDEKG